MIKINLFDLMLSISNVIDLISPAISDHHKRTAYIALCIAEEAGITAKEKDEIFLTAVVHDAGAVSLKERLDILRFETPNSSHAEMSYRFLKGFNPLKELAPIVRYHHMPWQWGRGIEASGQPVPCKSHILHLADRIAVLTKKEDVLGRAEEIKETIEGDSGRLFMPELVDAFGYVSQRESFWFDSVSPTIDTVLRSKTTLEDVEIDMDGLIEFGILFSRIIDFRSRFTSTHSCGVSASASALAAIAGFSEEQCSMMRCAGYLHDLGKLAVPAEILEKPTGLHKKEMGVIKSHTFYTYRVLEAIPQLNTINQWAALHHERLDGKGYPFHLGAGELSTGSRIMAVVDIFTALAEDRPYRKGLDRNGVTRIINNMTKEGAIDPDIVSLLEKNYETMDGVRAEAQGRAASDYNLFRGSEER